MTTDPQTPAELARLRLDEARTWNRVGLDHREAQLGIGYAVLALADELAATRTDIARGLDRLATIAEDRANLLHNINEDLATVSGDLADVAQAITALGPLSGHMTDLASSVDAATAALDDHTDTLDNPKPRPRWPWRRREPAAADAIGDAEEDEDVLAAEPERYRWTSGYTVWLHRDGCACPDIHPAARAVTDRVVCGDVVSAVYQVAQAADTGFIHFADCLKPDNKSPEITVSTISRLGGGWLRG
ncbi:hypothetical protein [Spongiactinospora sp. 9N601]|uniref:hypothetical protein n=1 Tax=Spongiactinospora sp. 9N601 TaxID=3375149 RepID=UPI0037BDB79C